MMKSRDGFSRSQIVIAAGAVAVGASVAARAALRAERKIDLHGKRVLITGGSRGLGLDLARTLVSRGAKVAICARDSDELDRAAAELNRFKSAAHTFAVQTFVCDLALPDQIESTIKSVAEKLGGLDVLINNAGLIQVGPMQQMELKDFDETMAVNFRAPLRAVLAAMPYLRKSECARIVNIASIGGKIAVPHLLPYSASKFALVGFTNGLRAELAREKIAVTLVIPGLFRSGSPRHAQFKGRAEDEFTWFASADSMPLLSMNSKRLAGRIVDACEHGDAELTAPRSVWFQSRFAGLLPEVTASLMRIANHFLPSPSLHGGRSSVTGDALSRAKIPAPLRAIDERSAQAHNQ